MPPIKTEEVSKNAHTKIERIKNDYLAAYRERWGEAAADKLSISYKRGWFFLTSSPLSPPYRAKEMRSLTKNLLKQAIKTRKP